MTTPIDEAFDAPTKTLVRYFVVLWEERLAFWEDYLDGKLPPTQQWNVHKSREGRDVDPRTSALRERDRVKELVDGWRRRLERE
jgi:hypothetical protein